MEPQLSEQQILQEGLAFGRYRLIAKLAVGGMAELFIARQKGVGGFSKTVVIKCILPYLAQDKDFTTMFLSEARLAAHLNHPNIVQIFDIGSIGGVYYMAMEYISGQNLRELTRKLYRQIGDDGTPPFSLIAAIFAQAAAGLDYVHKATDENNQPLHLVHRDISPNNVVVSYDGQVKIVDFGVAKARDQERETEVGVLKGRLSYMSPEQVSGFPLDGRSDVFSLGVVLYELTTNRRLFRRKSEPETIQALLHGPIPSPTHFYKNYPPELEAILMKMLERNPDDRYQSAGDLQVAFHSFLASQQAFLGPLDISKQMAELFAEEKQQAMSGRFEQPVTTNDLLNLSRGSYRIVSETSLPQSSPSSPPLIPLDYVGGTPSHSRSVGTGSFHPGSQPPAIVGQNVSSVSQIEIQGIGPQGPGITGSYESPRSESPSPFRSGSNVSFRPTPPIAPIESNSQEPEEPEDIPTEIVSSVHALEPSLHLSADSSIDFLVPPTTIVPETPTLSVPFSPPDVLLPTPSIQASPVVMAVAIPTPPTNDSPHVPDFSIASEPPEAKGSQNLWFWSLAVFLLLAGGVGGAAFMGLLYAPTSTQIPSIGESSTLPRESSKPLIPPRQSSIPLIPPRQSSTSPTIPRESSTSSMGLVKKRAKARGRTRNDREPQKNKVPRVRIRRDDGSVERNLDPQRKNKVPRVRVRRGIKNEAGKVLAFSAIRLPRRVKLKVYQKEDGERLYTSKHPNLCRRIERELSRLLGAKHRVTGITVAWQSFVKQRFARSRKTEFVFYPRAVAYVIYSRLLRGKSYSSVSATLVQYQKKYRFRRYDEISMRF